MLDQHAVEKEIDMCQFVPWLRKSQPGQGTD